MPEPSTEQIDTFIQRWEKSGAAERANYVLFLSELCDLIDVPRPDPAGPDNAANLYCFERAVVRRNPDGTTSLEQELLTRLVALNHERAAEEKRGLIRWLRLEFQNPQECATGVPPVDFGKHRQDAGGTLQQASQDELLLPPSSVIPQPSSFLPWPEEAPAQVAAVRRLLPSVGKDPEVLSACFGRKSKKRTDQIGAIIATLECLGYL